ncbi:MAG TPA: peptide deformylase [Longimicrobiales bacterium]|nr:peptide deformylase [Longimicrobiales bacterium]
MIREIRLLGDAILRAKAQPVPEVTEELRALLPDMFDTMYAAEGVGLAAPQIGLGIRVIVVDPHDEATAPFALINPEVVATGAEKEKSEEGCLSIPGIRELVERPTTCVVEGLDLAGEPVHMEAEGFLARILQHEVDHLNGVLFLDHLSPIKRRMAISRWKKERAK